MRRKRKGPARYEEWNAVLSRRLDYESAEILSCGSLKEKELYAPLFNRISDFVTDDFNKSRLSLDVEMSGTERVYALRKFSSRLKLLMFFKKLGFLRKEDKAALTDSLERATKAAAAALKERYGGDDPDLGHEICALESAFKTDTK
ncbi:MAG: hypothetical protein HFK09_07085 [Clostridia bacterium]|nr:hypothetical protein [Clostridia bacterium]